MSKKSISLIIISGTSGSGKTMALQVLEDLGYYSIDNLPASLLPAMANQALGNSKQFDRYAISIDSRNRDVIGNLEDIFTELQSLNIVTRVVFLDADDDTLYKRYSETRRKHPLSDKHTSLGEAITRERHMLEHIADIANFKLNTSKTTPHELRSIIRNYAAENDHRSMTLLFRSFGFKYGNPRDADFIFDVRCLPNPHWQADLKPLTGLDQPVQAFLESHEQTIAMYTQIRDFIDYWLPSFVGENRNYMTVAIGCTGGQHRSVYLGNRLRQHFSKNSSILTLLRHRELSHD